MPRWSAHAVSRQVRPEQALSITTYSLVMRWRDVERPFFAFFACFVVRSFHKIIREPRRSGAQQARARPGKGRRSLCAMSGVMSYAEAIRIAEEREKAVKEQFDRYDIDDSGSIDMDELSQLLDDLGLLTRLKTESIKFVTEMFLEHDKNDDGSLSFEEFKPLYNAAIDDSLGKKRPAKKAVVSRTASGLDSGTLAAREQLKHEKARKKAEEAERIRRENQEMKERVRAQGKGKDPKALDAEIEKQRCVARWARLVGPLTAREHGMLACGGTSHVIPGSSKASGVGRGSGAEA